MGEAKRKRVKHKESQLSCSGVQAVAGRVQVRGEVQSAATPRREPVLYSTHFCVRQRGRNGPSRTAPDLAENARYDMPAGEAHRMDVYSEDSPRPGEVHCFETAGLKTRVGSGFAACLS